MQIQMTRSITGVFHGRQDGVKVGDVVDVDDATGARYCSLGYALPVVAVVQEHAAIVVQTGEEHRGAVVHPPTLTEAEVKAAEEAELARMIAEEDAQKIEAAKAKTGRRVPGQAV